MEKITKSDELPINGKIAGIIMAVIALTIVVAFALYN